MLLKEVILQAATAVQEHRFRAGLTMLGIAWGIVTVVILMAYGQGFRGALVVGFRNAFSDGTAPALRRADQHAGGRRAGGPPHPAQGRRRRGRRGSSAPSSGQAPSTSRRCPCRTGRARRRRACAASRRSTASCGRRPRRRAGGSSTTTTSRSAGGWRSSAPRWRSGCSATSRPSARPSGSAGMTFEVVGVLAQKAQLSNYFYPDQLSVFIPWTTCEQLWSREYCQLPGLRGADTRAGRGRQRQVREVAGGAATGSTRATSARSAIFAQRADHRGIMDGMAGGLKIVLLFIGSLTLHDRRRRRDEHHARGRAGAHAGDRRPQGAGRAPPPHPRAVPAGGTRDHVRRAASSASCCRTGSWRSWVHSRSSPS